jgi:hypothetical protein
VTVFDTISFLENGHARDTCMSICLSLSLSLSLSALVFLLFFLLGHEKVKRHEIKDEYDMHVFFTLEFVRKGCEKVKVGVY